MTKSFGNGLIIKGRSIHRENLHPEWTLPFIHT